MKSADEVGQRLFLLSWLQQRGAGTQRQPKECSHGPGRLWDIGQVLPGFHSVKGWIINCHIHFIGMLWYVHKDIKTELLAQLGRPRGSSNQRPKKRELWQSGPCSLEWHGEPPGFGTRRGWDLGRAVLEAHVVELVVGGLQIHQGGERRVDSMAFKCKEKERGDNWGSTAVVLNLWVVT